MLIIINDRKRDFMKKYYILLALIILVLGGASYSLHTSDSLSISTFSKTAWTIKFNENEPLVSQPKIHDDNLYVQTENEIWVYSLSTGELVWKSQLPLEEANLGSSSPPPILIDQSRIVVQSQRNMISVFNKETGDIIWNTNNPSSPDWFVRDMILHDDRVVVSRNNWNISSYDVANGNLLWSDAVPSRTELRLFPFEEKIILGTSESLVLYSTNSGQMLESNKLNGFVDAYSLDNDHLYIVFDSGDCIFSSLNLRSMKNDWCMTPAYDFLLNNMEVIYDNENLYFFGNKMYGINKMTGITLWEAKPQDVFKYPVIIGGVIYVMDNHYLYKINKNSGLKIQKIELTNEQAGKIITLTPKWAPIITSDLIVIFHNKGITAYFNSIK